MTVYETLYLLALDDPKGDASDSVAADLQSTLAGAVLAELFLQERLKMSEGRVVIEDPTPTNRPLLDQALYDIGASQRPHKVKYWINHLSYKKIKADIAQELVEGKILERKDKRLVMPEAESEAEPVTPVRFVIKSRLREIVLAGKEAEMADGLVLAFLQRNDLLKLVFTYDERKAARAWVKKLFLLDEEGNSVMGSALSEIAQTAHDFEK